ncbi:MAG: hypothetical protein WCW13_06380 [archaeon]|jgi:hypothetical protein
MQTGFLVPLLGSSTKSAIVQVLTEKPLTLKELNAQVNKTIQKPITYQALHKATKEMINDGILIKNLKNIEINKEWIGDVEKFVTHLKTAGEQQLDKQSSFIEKFEVDTFVDFGKFVIKFFHDTPNIKNNPGVCIMQHSWPIFGMGKVDYEILTKLLKETTFYDLVINDTPLDRAFGKVLEKLGKKVKTGVSFDTNCDIVCKGQNIFYIYFSNELKEKFENMFNKFTSLEELDMNDLMNEVMSKKTRITIIHVIDKTIANDTLITAIKAHNAKSQ